MISSNYGDTTANFYRKTLIQPRKPQWKRKNNECVTWGQHDPIATRREKKICMNRPYRVCGRVNPKFPYDNGLHWSFCVFLYSFFLSHLSIHAIFHGVWTTKQIFFTSFIRFILILRASDTGHSSLTNLEKRMLKCE